MAITTGTPFPYDVENLLGGAARILMADTSQAIPAHLDDVFDIETPYTSKVGWTDVGAAREGASYSRDIGTDGYEIQQLQGNVIQEITEIERSLEISMAEIKAEHFQIVEEAQSVGTVAAAAGKSALKQVKIGSFADTTYRRIALVAQRNKVSGEVTESGAGAPKRGRFVGLILYRCTIAADETSLEFEKGNLVHAPLTFIAYPEASQPQGQEYGTWFTEDAGVIA